MNFFAHSQYLHTASGQRKSILHLKSLKPESHGLLAFVLQANCTEYLFFIIFSLFFILLVNFQLWLPLNHNDKENSHAQHNYGL